MGDSIRINKSNLLEEQEILDIRFFRVNSFYYSKEGNHRRIIEIAAGGLIIGWVGKPYRHEYME